MAKSIKFEDGGIAMLGMEDASRKYKRSKKRERNVFERETHNKKGSKRRLMDDELDYYDEY